MSSFSNVWHCLLSDPWPIMPETHALLMRIVSDHTDGSAHEPGGRAATFIREAKGPASVMEIRDGVAVISLYGVIGRRVGNLERSSGVTDVMDLQRALRSAASNADVRGVLLDVDSPGGALPGIPEAAADVRALVASGKPVVAWTGGLMASAAYWISSQASEIVASRSASVGSLGVYAAFLDESRAMQNAGMSMHVVSTGRYKGMGLRGMSLTADQLALLRARVDEAWTMFKGDMALTRNIPAESLEGQLFTAAKAVENDVADVVGDEEIALAELAGLIGRCNLAG